MSCAGAETASCVGSASNGPSVLGSAWQPSESRLHPLLPSVLWEEAVLAPAASVPPLVIGV